LQALAPRTAWRASAWYLVVTLAMTWPLATGLARDIPWDLGDSLLNCWILGWNSEHILRALHGDWAALAGFYDANIFYPQRLTLAYSELLLAQTVQGLPVYATTGNLILTYNVVFLATFVLSGLGAFLLVRQLTGDWRAGFAAGLVYAFLPWRFGQMPHMQVLSSQWMPFVLYGLSRYFDTGRGRALAGAGAALVANNLSNGYFLLFFAPFVPAYALWEMARRGRLTDVRPWVGLGATAAGVAACTVPFLMPYVWLRQGTGEHRGIGEVAWFSADVYAYLTAEFNLTLLGSCLRTFPRAEGDLFPGFTPLLLSSMAVAMGLARAMATTRSAGGVVPSAATATGAIRRAAVLGGFVLAAVYGPVLLVVLAGYGGKFTIGSLDVRVNSVTNAARMLVVAAVLLCAGSARIRAMVARGWRSPIAFFVLLVVVGWWLSLGPRPQSWGRELNAPGLYALLYQYVPGFDGLRVPARFAVLVMLGLSVLSGFAVRDVLRRRPAAGPAMLALAALFLAESTPAPIPVNVTASDKYLAPPSRVFPPWQAPPAYQHLATLPASTVVLELPFGDPAWELRYVYYSTVHWRPLVNGYSGGFPDAYLRLRSYLDDPRRAPNDGFAAMMAAGATHLVLHTAAYRGDEALEIRAWLESHGLRASSVFGPDLVYQLR
jgi:sorbitol-specific phosphotransferase system component IIC